VKNSSSGKIFQSLFFAVPKAERFCHARGVFSEFIQAELRENGENTLFTDKKDLM